MGSGAVAMLLSEAFDGQTHWLVPDVDFVAEPRGLHVADWDEDEDEILDPFESPTPEPVWIEKPAVYSAAGPSLFQREGASWAGVALAFNSLCQIIGGAGSKAYQHNTYDDHNKMEQPRYSLTFVPGETGYQEGRL